MACISRAGDFDALAGSMQEGCDALVACYFDRMVMYTTP
jgi:hypothetical protein